MPATTNSLKTCNALRILARSAKVQRKSGPMVLSMLKRLTYDESPLTKRLLGKVAMHLTGYDVIHPSRLNKDELKSLLDLLQLVSPKDPCVKPLMADTHMESAEVKSKMDILRGPTLSKEDCDRHIKELVSIANTESNSIRQLLLLFVTVLQKQRRSVQAILLVLESFPSELDDLATNLFNYVMQVLAEPYRLGSDSERERVLALANLHFPENSYFSNKVGKQMSTGGPMSKINGGKNMKRDECKKTIRAMMEETGVSLTPEEEEECSKCRLRRISEIQEELRDMQVV